MYEFIKDFLLQPLIMWNDYSVFEPEHPFAIHMETTNLGITLSQPSLDVGYTNILLLTDNDSPPPQGWGEGHTVECYVWRYSDARFFSGEVNNR
jgi:hypothetical protein